MKSPFPPELEKERFRKAGEPKHTETQKLGVNIVISAEMAERCKTSKPARDKVCKEVAAVVRSQLINGPPYVE